MGSGKGTRPRATIGISVTSSELDLPEGSKIEFDGTLQYGGKDTRLTGNARTAVEAFETKRGKNKIEYCIAYDMNGNQIGREKRGGRGSVRADYGQHSTPNSVFTHIHPRGAGELGGTFSVADMNNFANGKNIICRAKAKEGTYSIHKTDRFNSRDFKRYCNSMKTECHSRYSKKFDSLTSEYHNSKMSYDDYKKGAAKEFNNYLIDLHNGFLKGQSKYGYKYTLEK